MECPWCHEQFVENTMVVCDNDCATIFCRKCDGDVIIVDGKYVGEHDPKCGEESGEMIN